MDCMKKVDILDRCITKILNMMSCRIRFCIYISRLRYKGEKFMHTKWILLAIVLLNIVDCILVMGELILDIYYLKGMKYQQYRWQI